MCRLVFYTKVMNIKSYIDEVYGSVEKFAKKHKFHRTTVFKWIAGTASPTSNNFAKLLKITNGKVTPNDFYKINNKSN